MKQVNSRIMQYNNEQRKNIVSDTCFDKFLSGSKVYLKSKGIK